MSEYPPEIVKAIAAVRKEVPYLKKDARNEHFKYAYVSEGQVLGAVRTAMDNAGLVIFPHVVGVAPGDKGIVTVEMEFQIAHDSGAVWPERMKWLGMGQDTQDKAIAKAATSGLKYFLLKLFMIETGDDPDKDAGVVVKAEKPQAPSTPPAAQKNAPTASVAPQTDAPDDRPPQIEESTVDLWISLVKKAPTGLDLTAIGERMKVDLGRMTPEQKAKIKAAGTKRRKEITDSPGGLLAPPDPGPLPGSGGPPGSSTPEKPIGRMPLDAAAVLDSMALAFKEGDPPTWLKENGAKIADIKSGAWRDYVHALYKHEQGSE